MEEVNKAWDALLRAMIKMSDPTSEEDADRFNRHAKVINSTMTQFKDYHLNKQIG